MLSIPGIIRRADQLCRPDLQPPLAHAHAAAPPSSCSAAERPLAAPLPLSSRLRPAPPEYMQLPRIASAARKKVVKKVPLKNPLPPV